MVALAAADAILDAGSEVAPANHAVEGPAEGLLYEEPSIFVGMAAQARPIIVVRAITRMEHRLRDILPVDR